MRQLAAGVTLVTTATAGGARAGLTATAVCSASADPPQLLACVNRDAEAHDLLWRAGSSPCACSASASAPSPTGSPADRRVRRGPLRRRPLDHARHRGARPRGRARLLRLPHRRHPRGGTHTVLLATVEATLVRPGIAPLAYLDGGYGLVRHLPGEPGPEPLQP
jgi:hypothetical protein